MLICYHHQGANPVRLQMHDAARRKETVFLPQPESKEQSLISRVREDSKSPFANGALKYVSNMKSTFSRMVPKAYILTSP